MSTADTPFDQLIQSILYHSKDVEDVEWILKCLEHTDWQRLLDERSKERDQQTRDDLIHWHEEEIAKLQNKPVPMRLRSDTDRIIEDSLDSNMVKWHQFAVDQLTDGVDISETRDGLTSEELLACMREDGYFVCFHDEEDELRIEQ